MISSRWAIQRVFDMTIKNVVTDKPYVKVNDLNECNLEANQENVYSSGGAGNAYITSHSHSKRLTGSASAATFYNDVISLINGTDVIVGATPTIPISEELIVTSDGASTTYTATGTVGSEITALHIYNADGSFGEEYVQAAIVSSGKFTYNPTTKELVFNTSDIEDDTKIIAFYNVDGGDSTYTINSNVDEFSKIVKIELLSLVQDACSGEEYPAIITVPKAKLTGSFSMATAKDGDPASLDVSFETMQASCISKKLWDMKIYDSSELS